MERRTKSRARELIDAGGLPVHRDWIAPLPDPLACVHRGDVTRTELCAACGGNVQIKVQSCTIHGECTISNKAVAGATNCQGCKSRALPGQLTLDAYRPILHAAREAARTADPPLGFRGRGIVIVAGGERYFPSAYVLVRLLRYLGCNLPIEWWHFGAHEMDSRMVELAQGLGNVSCRDLSGLRNPPAGGWQAKIAAIQASEFAEVLFLDADQIPADDPTYLFEEPAYRAAGAVFWEDLRPAGWDIRTEAFDLCGLPVPGRTTQPNWKNPTDYRPFETGQLLVDKTRHWPAIALCRHLNDFSEVWYPAGRHGEWLIYGDKSTFLLAWEMLGSSYAMPPPPTWTGNAHGGCFLQRDFANRVILAHRSQPPSKLSLDPRRNVFTPDTPHAGLIVQYLAELANAWEGRTIPFVIAPEHRGVAEALVGSRWLMKRAGAERELILRAHGRTSDGTIGWTLEGPWPALALRGPRWSEHLYEDTHRNWISGTTGSFLMPIPRDVDYHRDLPTLQVVNSLLIDNEYRLPAEIRGLVLDIGGHIGSFAICCAERGAKRVLSVEPDSANFRALAANLAPYRPRVSALFGGAWSSSETIALAQPPGALHTGGWSAVHPRADAAASPAYHVNDLIQLVGTVDLLKLDCEGAEWEILTAADLSHVAAICGEYHLAPIERGEVDAGFGLEWLRERLDAAGFRLRTKATLSNLGLFWAVRETSPLAAVWR
jgi:FkbM family methyltransferase